MRVMDPRSNHNALIPAFRLPEPDVTIYRRGQQLLLERDGELVPTPEPRYEVLTGADRAVVSARAYLLEVSEGAFAYDPRNVFRADDLAGALLHACEVAERDHLTDVVHLEEDVIEVLDPSSVTLKVFADETSDVRIAWVRLQRAAFAFIGDEEGADVTWQQLVDARAVLASHLGHAPARMPQPAERPWLRGTHSPATAV